MSATNIISNPFPLGKISPGASFATVSTPITTNFSDLAVLFCDSINIRNHPDSSGNIYVCNSAAQPDTTLFENVIDVIGPGGSYTNTSSAMNTIGSLGGIYIGADDATSYAVVSVRFR